MKKRLFIVLLVALVVAMSVAFAGCGNTAPAAGGDNGATAPATSGDNGAAAPADSGSDSVGTADTTADATATADEFDTYIAAAKAMDDAENISMDMNTQTNMTVAGQTMDMTMSGTVQMDRTSGSLQMQMDVKTTTAGQEIPMTVFYKDGYTYINMMNGAIKMKTAQSEEEMLSSQDIGVQIFDKQYVKDMSSTKTADGTQYTFTLDGKGLGALAQNVENSVSSDADASVSDIGMSFGDATVIVNLDNSGTILNENITMSFTMKAGDQDVTADIQSTIDNIKLGGVNITFPADLDSYTEAPAAA